MQWTLKSDVDEKVVADVMFQMTQVRKIDERIVVDATMLRMANVRKNARAVSIMGS
eukprot:jgi/Bigna1/63913/fgenesh1_kg.62_\